MKMEVEMKFYYLRTPLINSFGSLTSRGSLYVPVTKDKAATVRMSMSIISVPKKTHTWILSFLTLISLSRSITFSGSGHSTLIESDVFSRCIKESDVLASRDFAFPRVAPRVTDTLEPRDFNLKF